MTVTTTRHAEPTDILAIRVRCNKCKTALSVPLATISNVPSQCPNCSTMWGAFEGEREVNDAVQGLIIALRKLGRLHDGKRVAVSIEVANEVVAK